MLDPKDVAEAAVVSIAPEVLARLIEQYDRYRTESTLLYLRSALAIEARRALDQHPPLED